MEFLPDAFKELNAVRQFILYKLVPSKNRPGKTDKFPINHLTNQIDNAHNSSIWIDFQTAIQKAKALGTGYGVGFVLTADDPYWFLDIDNCLEPCGTKWSSLANTLLTAFPGAVVEISSSMRGLHILGKGKPPAHGCRNGELGLEFYTQGRFVALTGIQAQGSFSQDWTPTLSWLVNTYFPTNSSSNQIDPAWWSDEPVAEWNGPADDDVLIERACRSVSSRGVFDGGASFNDLWTANADVLAKSYPDDGGRQRAYNESSADAALAQHLAFWTGNDAERILRLMQRSALAREKWEREDYLRLTIRNACRRQTVYLQDKRAEPIDSTIQSQEDSIKPQLVQGSTFLSVEEQVNTVFKGCVYVMDEHKVLVPGGYMLNPERFRALYGGYSMMMGGDNSRVSRNAWEAFTESQGFRAPRAHSHCFDPRLKPGRIIESEGQTLVNTYWPVKIKRIQGSVEPMLRHLELLFPDPRDRLIFLSYMAALVQYPGYKFTWAPIVQGVQGNGKTLFSLCVRYAVGTRYSHFPNAADLANKFNEWLYGKIFISVEDIYNARDPEMIERLKVFVTGEFQEIHGKGSAQVTRNVCANFIFNSNHKDALQIQDNERRFAPFYTSQQSVQDLRRDGMDAVYFQNLFKWLNTDDGFAKFAEYLYTFDIPDELNPVTLCRRAPQTSSTAMAIIQSVGSVEQEILEAIDQGQTGFKGGWISSFFLDQLIDRMKATRRVPRNKRREMLKVLGYDWHPNLPDGRTTAVVLPDGTRPRLYVHRDSHRLKALTGVDIHRAYSEANGVTSS